MELLLYIILWYIFVRLTKNWRSAPIYTYLIYMYFVGMLCAFLLFNFTDIYKGETTNILSCEAIVYHVCYLGVFFLSIKQIESRIDTRNIECIAYKTLRPYLLVLIALSLVSIVTSIMIIDSLSSLSIEAIRTDVMINGEGRELKASGSLLSHISAIASEYSYIVLLLAFYCISFYPTKTVMIYLLLISAFAYLFYNLEIGGREAIIRYVFDFAFVYIIFRNHIGKSWKKKIKMAFAILGVTGMLLMVSITIARFYLTQDAETLISGSVGYFSQGFIYFSKFYEYFVDSDMYKSTIFYAFFHGPRISMFELVDAPFPTNSFSTFVGTIVLNMGRYKALIPLLLFVLVTKFIAKMKPTTIFYYIYMFWIMRMAFAGIFYWIDNFIVGARIYYFMIIFLLHFLYGKNIKSLV